MNDLCCSFPVLSEGRAFNCRIHNQTPVWVGQCCDNEAIYDVYSGSEWCPMGTQLRELAESLRGWWAQVRHIIHEQVFLMFTFSPNV